MAAAPCDISADMLGRFEELALRATGVAFARGGRAGALRVLRDAVADRCDIGALFDLLESPGGRPELERLVAEATVKETYFFRAWKQFDALGGAVLRETAAARSVGGAFARRRMRVWSAGCATGEETFSAAMAIHEVLDHPGAWDLRVLGTDLSTDALEHAAAGLYRNARFPAALPARFIELADKYMPDGPDGRSIAERVRSIVEFSRLNLVADEFPDDQDVIFCRNVMIYFPLAAQPALIERLFAALRPGGWLFLGDAELLHVHRHGFTGHDIGGALVYRKPGGLPLDDESLWRTA